MALRPLVIVLALLSPGRAWAERRVNTLWQDVCVYALTLTDVGRAEVAPFASTSLGGGLDRYLGTGATVRLQFPDGWYGLMEAHVVSAERRLDTPVPVTQARRRGGGIAGVGWTPFVGKVSDGDDVYRFDIVTAVGAGIAFVRGPYDDHAEGHFALGAELALRVRVTDSITVDLGLHDEYVPYANATAAEPAARMTSPALALPPSAHEVSVRFGIGGWIPDGPTRRCVYRCSPLRDAPAVRY